MNRRIILSPCGTSILTNNRSRFDDLNIIGLSNETEKSLDTMIKSRLLSILEPIEWDLINADVKTKKRISAELNALYTLEKDNLSKETTHVLLATDTFLGGKTAEIIESVLKHEGVDNVQTISVPGLRTLEIIEFRQALSELLKRLDEMLPGYRESGYEVIFNLTGGFKSIQGFLQSIAPFYADKSVYIFESNKELLTIPSLPVTLDDEAIVSRHLNLFRRLFLDLEVRIEEIEMIPEIYWWRVENMVMLTEWGILSFQRAKNTFYEKNVYPAPSSKIETNESLINELKARLDKKRKKEFNETMDDLARYLETKQQLKSSTFKKLVGKPKGDSTHECYLNSDNAERIYCHYENDKLVIDEVGKHL